MRLRSLFFVLSLAFTAFIRPLPAQTAPVSSAPAAAAETDPWLGTLSALLVDRYKVSGELQLSWNRARPANASAASDLIIINAPVELAPQILVTVRATDEAGRVTDHTVILRAELWRDGWILREPAVTASAVDIVSLDTRRFDVLREREAIPADTSAELNFARNVPAGRLLTWRDVVRRPLVRRGQSVEVLATDGNLIITLRALALQDAARGEPVRVRNPDSKKEFIALVVAESRASVRF